jgi:hypothetical protein
MAYGQNKPWGLQAVRTITGAPWNGQLDGTQKIRSGYANNIANGDLVYIGDDGYVHNLSDLQAAPLREISTFGVFAGCSYETTAAVNPIDPASQGRPFWPAGTVTLNGQDAQAFIISDPNVVFSIQTGQVGANIANIGAAAAVVYTYVDGSQTNAAVDTKLNGTSLMTIGMGTVARNNPRLNLRILNISQVEGNNPGESYNNVDVVIQNHALLVRSRPDGAV